MTTTSRHLAPGASAIFVVIAFLTASALSVTPVVPGVQAVDPTDVPSQSPDPGPTPLPEPSPTAATDPTLTPTPDPTLTPTPDPTLTPTPDPTLTPTPDPMLTPAPDPTPTDSPSASPPQPSGDPPAPSASLDPGPSSSPPGADPSPTPLPGDQPGVSPMPSDQPGATPSPEPSATLDPSPAASGDPPLPGVVGVDAYAVDRLSRATGAVTVGLPDAPLRGAERYRPLRLRMHVHNGTDAAIELSAQLEYTRPGDEGAFRPVPVAAWTAGEAFYARLNPATTVALPAGDATEIAFDLRATADARWDASYSFRVSDVAVPIEMALLAVIETGPKPPIALSPGQVDGQPVAGAALRYPLVGFDAATVRAAVRAVAGDPSPHGAYTLVTDACAACHRSHVGEIPPLGASGPGAASVCFRCHGAPGSASDVERQFDDPSLPVNDPAGGAWYSHPATVPSGHTSDADDEFGGRLERHAECADCHDPHRASAGLASATTAGWTRSGALEGVSGTALVAGDPGAPPTYVRTGSVTLEYQLCLKCHSGSTQLPVADPAHPSRWALDKGREIDPGAGSYHPIAAPGTNTTAAISNSLAGSSPSKLWIFQADATIRCVGCHGDPAKATPSSPPGAGDRLAAHASANRGLLMAPYRDRSLSGRGSPYAAGDFALCYQCHGESPYVDRSGDANDQTAFNFHGLHVSDIALTGSGGTDIDVAGSGQGNAVCAECHFRIHGSALALNPDDRDNARLVSFGPNVEPLNGTLRWTQAGAGGTCTLVCHGVSHAAESYGP